MPVCKFFLKGSGCAKGEECRFPHQVESQAQLERNLELLKLDPHRGGTKTHSSTKSIPTPSIDSQDPLAGVTCRFFQKGACKNGDQCRFQHGIKDPERLENSSAADIACRFYQKGACKNGVSCIYRHDARFAEQESTQNAQKTDGNNPTDVDSVPSMPKELLPKSIESNARNLDGALVTFGAGAAVLKVEPTVSTGSRLQMCNTTCTWYAPSKTATLEYTSVQQMEHAVKRLTRKRILDRQLSCKTAIDKKQKPWRCLVKVGNLDVLTTGEALAKESGVKPHCMIMGESSYSSTTEGIGRSIQQLLATIGSVEAWSMTPTGKSSQIKATATFSTKEEAARAVKEFNGHMLPQLGGSKVFMSHLIKAKFSIMTPMYSVISAELSTVQQRLSSTGYLEIKAYPPSDNMKRFTVLHVVSDTTEKVGKAKAAVEKILKGHVAKSGQGLVWHDFFLKPEGIAFINGLGKQHKIFIHRDARRLQLHLYGNEEGRAIAESALIKVVDDLSVSTCEFELDDQLPEALHQASYRTIVEKLGKAAVRLNVMASPKRITFSGSSNDADWVRSVLKGASSQIAASTIDRGEGEVCAVCWCDMTEAYSTSCGHLYDKECFLGQCTSAGDGGFPIKCLGASGACQAVIPFAELASALNRSQLDELLELSFKTFIERHPTEYQSCPTAGCGHVYRRTTEADVHMCSTCLTSVCTACGEISHEGRTCEESKNVDRAFEEWKRENGAKDCPKCAVVIQKSEGCNHMTCKRCRAHLCWICLAMFVSANETYDHLVAAHDGIFDAGYRGF